MRAHQTLDKEIFDRWVKKGASCKEIAGRMGWSEQCFGIKMKSVLGIYPSVYIARMMKNGKA